jgi:NADH-quinone oxidoreductase E subunit
MTAKICACGGLQADPRLPEFETVLSEFKGNRGALIQVLHKAQGIFGYLSDEVQERVAAALEVPLSEVYGVATFYSLFSLKPQGEYKIGVCLGTACYVRGAQQVLNEIEKQLDIKLNDTTADGKFTLEVTRCIGACGLAPVMTINEDVYGRVEAANIAEILKKY